MFPMHRQVTFSAQKYFLQAEEKKIFGQLLKFTFLEMQKKIVIFIWNFTSSFLVLVALNFDIDFSFFENSIIFMFFSISVDWIPSNINWKHSPFQIKLKIGSKNILRNKMTIFLKMFDYRKFVFCKQIQFSFNLTDLLNKMCKIISLGRKFVN